MMEYLAGNRDCAVCGFVRPVEALNEGCCALCHVAARGLVPAGWMLHTDRAGQPAFVVQARDQQLRPRVVLVRARGVTEALVDASEYAALVGWTLVQAGHVVVRYAVECVAKDLEFLECLAADRAEVARVA